jgi:hypothetical protein
MVTPLLFNSNMILPSLQSATKHLTPATSLISVEKAVMCHAHKHCLICFVASELVTTKDMQHSEIGCSFETLKSVATFPPSSLVPYGSFAVFNKHSASLTLLRTIIALFSPIKQTV